MKVSKIIKTFKVKFKDGTKDTVEGSNLTFALHDKGYSESDINNVKSFKEIDSRKETETIHSIDDVTTIKYNKETKETQMFQGETSIKIDDDCKNDIISAIRINDIINIFEKHNLKRI